MPRNFTVYESKTESGLFYLHAGDSISQPMNDDELLGEIARLLVERRGRYMISMEALYKRKSRADKQKEESQP